VCPVFLTTVDPQLVEALCYKPGDRRFEFRWGGFFLSVPNPSIRTMALWLIQPLKEMSTRNLPRGKGGRPALKADNLTGADCLEASTSHNAMNFHGFTFTLELKCCLPSLWNWYWRKNAGWRILRGGCWGEIWAQEYRGKLLLELFSLEKSSSLW
jgi:hypothetical protein